MTSGWRAEARVSSFVTTNAYTLVTGSKIDAYAADQSYSVVVRETVGTNGATFKVQVSDDDTNWADHPDASLVDETVAANGVQARHTADAAYRFYRVVAKSTSTDAPATISVAVIAK